MVSIQQQQQQQWSSSRRRMMDLKTIPGPSTSNVDVDTLTRTPWANARLALDLIKKDRAGGNKAALWLRAKLQDDFLFPLGQLAHAHAGKILLAGALVVLILSLGLKSAKIENRVDKLWVQEGGRLERELKYVEKHLGVGAGATNEMLIQTPLDESGTSSVLTSESLLAHLDILRAASKVVVESDDTAWSLKDLCYAQTIPTSESQLLDSILENLFPCSIITPLDCFWEGSKLLGPDMPVNIPLGGEDGGTMPLSWTSLNPLQLLRQMGETTKYFFDFQAFEEYMKRAGITTGYQEKPCLDPYDPDCPPTAPNKYTKQRPDVGAELTGGCYGFATRYNHWPEQLIVGGVTKNDTGYIVRSKGLQSVIQLMGEKDFYEYWSETYKTHTLGWSPAKAKSILTAWQASFGAEVRRLAQSRNLTRYDINAFSSAQLDTIMEEFSEFSWTTMAIGYAFMLLYAGAALFRWRDVVLSQCGLGVSGVLLVGATICAGLGACAFLGLEFNAATTQFAPYLALGLGVDAMFVMVREYTKQLVEGCVSYEDHIGEVLSRTGVLVLLSGGCVIASLLLAAALIPIPAMRGLGLQAAVLGSLNLAAMILLFPALMALDLRRVAAGKTDLACCYTPKRRSLFKKEEKAQDKSTPKKEVDLLDLSDPNEAWPTAAALPADEQTDKDEQHFLIGPLLAKTPVKALVLLASAALTVAGAWCAFAHLEDGLSLSELVPASTNASERRFLAAQERYFGYYNMYAVTQDNFDYPRGQRLLYDYHAAFVRVNAVVKDDNGGLPEFWLPLFRTWLVKMQGVFDEAQATGVYSPTAGWSKNATDEQVLALKLMVQTGHVDYPVDLTLQSRNRLVDAHGIINQAAFYNYLTAWYSSDAMAYSFSQASLAPVPRDWVHDRRDDRLRIPKSPPIAYAQMPFHLNGLGETNAMLDMLRQVRAICERFENRGLPNFPRGVPFTFWEQYLGLRVWLAAAAGCVLAASAVTLTAFFASARIAAIGVFVDAVILVQLLGFMGATGIRLSAIPAVVVILAAGMGVQFAVHILMGFSTAIGNKNRRMIVAVENMSGPVIHGTVTTFLGILMLAFSDFDFVYRYFFLVLSALLLIGIFNGMALLPILLAALGPPAELIPNEGDGDQIVLPSPEQVLRRHHQPAPKQPPPPKPRLQLSVPSSTSSRHRSSSSSSRRQQQHYVVGLPPKRHTSDSSLSTIAEESHSYVSSSAPANHNSEGNVFPATHASFGGTSVVVEPEVVVEIPSYPSSGSQSSSRCSTPSQQQQSTKVTATAKFKVEVHAPTSNRRRRSPRLQQQQQQQQQPQQQQQTTTDGSSSVHSSLSSDSVSSSLSSNEGDLGFSER